MNDDSEAQTVASKTDSEFYGVVDAQAQREYVEARTAAKWIGFLLPHVSKGMSVLDCGCGVGSITLDLAEIVAPGQVIGLDIDPEQLKIAGAQAQKRGLTNVNFDVANVYNLPFTNASFDVILAHTLLIHLNDPLAVLKEIHRVLKPGGIVAVSDDDYDTFVISPSRPLIEKFFKVIWPHYIGHNGGSPNYARHLRHLLLEAGFTKTEGHAVAAEYHGTLEATQHFAMIGMHLFDHATFSERMIKQGLTNKQELNAIREEMLLWSERPDAFLAWMYCAALGWRVKETP